MKITITLEEINPENGKSYRLTKELLEEDIELNTRSDLLFYEYMRMKAEFNKKKKIWLGTENEVDKT